MALALVSWFGVFPVGRPADGRFPADSISPSSSVVLLSSLVSCVLSLLLLVTFSRVSPAAGSSPLSGAFNADGEVDMIGDVRDGLAVACLSAVDDEGFEVFLSLLERRGLLGRREWCLDELGVSKGDFALLRMPLPRNPHSSCFLFSNELCPTRVPRP
jgi:hypothetical protein